MTLIYHGDCNEMMDEIPDNSVDLIFTDLPYGQVSCEWDKKIDFPKMWEQFKRIKKLNTPIFFCCSTKFGVEIINSAPKKIPFRYDIVWVKSAPCGFLCAKKMPMKKHEMLYVFYEKLPFYDLSSHQHKFLKDGTKSKEDNCYGVQKLDQKGTYDPPLPVSVVKEEPQHKWVKGETNIYGGAPTEDSKDCGGHQKRYDPPLPVSVIKEANTGECYGKETRDLTGYDKCGKKGKNQVLYDPPLPVSVVKENPDYDKRDKKTRDTIKKEEVFGKSYLEKKVNFRKFDPTLGGTGAPSHLYDPPLPVSVVKEVPTNIIDGETYNTKNRKKPITREPADKYDPPLPVSVVKEEIKYDQEYNSDLYGDVKRDDFKERKNSESRYDPPLPNSILEIKSQRGKHSTQKPTELMKWVLKYYSKEGDTILDPTMGSGSTGVACMEMNRNFIGMEMDPEIFEVARNRLET